MRLLLVNYEYPPLGGGAATATQALGRCFAGMGHRVIVLTSGIANNAGQTREDDVTVIRLHTGRRRSDRASVGEMLAFLSQAALRLTHLNADHRPDFAIVFFSVPCGPLGWLVRARFDVPYIISLRGGDVPGFLPELNIFHALLAPVRRACLRRAHAIVANSPSLASLAKQADGGRIEIIPNGVDADRFLPAGHATHGGAFRFIFVGRLTQQKRLDMALSAFGRIRDARPGNVPIRLSVVGDGPLRKELTTHAERLGIGDDVEWHGWVTRDRLCELYRQANYLLHPSSIEGMSNTVLEAMAVGLPVISSDGPGNRDIVVDEENGILFRVDDVNALAKAMTRVVGDPALHWRLSSGSRETVLARHSWESAAQAYLALIGEPQSGGKISDRQGDADSRSGQIVTTAR